MKYGKVIFVCGDNTCLSPAAESIFNEVSVGTGIRAESRGVVVLFDEPMNAKMVSVMKSHGLEPVREMSRQLEAEDISGDTLILAMTEQEVSMIRERFPDAHLFRLRDFVGETGDVPVPLGGSLADYGLCYEHIDLLTKMAAERIFKEAENDSTGQ